MKRKKNNNFDNSPRLKSGAASLYIVIFTTVLLGIITVSFIRIMFSESSQTANNDLSQSAYDAALAGVEDAKLSLLKYHDCLSQGYHGKKDSTTPCEKIIYEMSQGIKVKSCDTVAKVIGRTIDPKDQSVVIQETQDNNTKGSAKDMQQAYTCIKIDEELPDYRSTVTSESRTRIIPVRSADSNLNYINFKWFSANNKSGKSLSYMNGTLESNDPGNPKLPPAILLRLFQTDQTFRLHELDASSYSGTDQGSILLYPSNSGTNLIPLNSPVGFLKSNNKARSNDKAHIGCRSSVADDEFFCEVKIALPKPYNGGSRNPGSLFFVVSLPYGQPATDFSLSLCSDSTCKQETSPKFTGVQALIDSTGRANDLYRRVEARVELVDIYYPYPEFSLQIQNGDDEESIKKNFWITRNCWNSDNGNITPCNNNDSVD